MKQYYLLAVCFFSLFSVLQAKEPKDVSLHVFNEHISGPELTAADLKGKVVVAQQWQSHCGACPEHLASFERLARRNKKKEAVFVIWHSFDKVELAKKKSEELKLKLPVYHGTFFNPAGWPNVLLYDREGKIVYSGLQNSKFRSALRKELAKK